MASVTTDGTTPDGGQGTAALVTPATGVARAPVKPRRVTRREQGTMSWRVRLRRDKALVIMTLPAIVLLAVFGYAPMLGLVMAFQSYDIYNGFLHSPWVGLANFQQLFGDPGFWHAFWNTLALFSVQLVLFFPIPIALAILIDSLLSRKLRSFIQSVVTLPHFFSWVLVVTVFQQMLGGAGLIPSFLRQHGVTNPFDIMTSPATFKLLVSSQLIWKEAGWGTIVFLAALAAISPSLYEAAAVDGAGRWRRMRHITLPGLKGITILLLILNLGYALTFGFEQMLIQRGAVGPGASEVLTTFSYEFGIVNGNYSYGAAAGLFLGVTSLVLILAANKVAHLFGEDGLYRR
jgi:putative aldouronate transport system permease protein